MGKRKTSSLPLLIFLGLAAVAVGGGAFWMLREQHAPAGPQAAFTAPALPTGKLEFLTTGVSDARLWTRDLTGGAPDGRLAIALTVGKSPKAIDNRYAMVVRHETVDCRGSQSRIFNEMAGEYDAKGLLVNSELLTGAAGRPATDADAEVRPLCQEKPRMPGRTVVGYLAAQREVQSPPDDLYAQATAKPQDADLWAWVCAAGARGRWSPSLPKDCDHAVQLNPKSTPTILDRGFLKLVLGKRPAAKADFNKALAIEPANPEALFGRSLVSALDGDLAASKRDRAQALNMRPGVPDWIEATYRFQISDAFRK